MSSNPLEGISADVLAVMGHQERREELAGLPRWKRNQIARDKKRVKVTIDLTDFPELEDKLRAMADGEGVGISSMAIWLIALGVQNYREPPVQPSRSMKHSFDIVPPSGLLS